MDSTQDNDVLLNELKESEARNQAILDSAVDGIITIDQRGAIKSFNPAAERIFGYSSEEVLGQNVKMLMNAHDQARHDTYLQNYLTTGDEKIIGKGREVTGRRKDGSAVSVALGVSEFRVGEKRSFVGIIRDTTETKRASEELRQTTARLTLAAKAANVGIWDYNVVSNELLWDDAMYALYGITENTFSGAYEAWEKGLHPEDLARAATELQDALKGEKEFDTEFRVVWPDGSQRHIKAAATVLRDSDGTPLRMIGTNWDITDRVESAEALTRAKERAEAYSRSKSEFLANMSHELRTPLNAIIGFSEVLLDGSFGDLNEKQRRYTNNVLKSGRHLLLLINDILDLSKVEAGKMELELSNFRVARILRDSLNMVREAASRVGLKLSADLAAEVEKLELRADVRKFKQVLFNLLSNAVKFTPEGGRVELSAHICEDELIISVSDTGIGIAPEEQERIFSEFVQVDSSLSRRHDGTGLGLALVQKLLALHDGRVWVQSEGIQGKGTTFFIAFPISSSGEFAVPRVAVGDGNPLILVVEDCPNAQELLSLHLSSGGYRVELAPTGEEAVARARDLQPACITLDVNLGALDGFQVLAELQAREQTKSIPVIMVSMLDDRQLAYSLGATDYLAKPVERKALLQAIHSVLGERTERKKKVLIVDDEPNVLELLRGILSSEEFQVLEASGGSEALEILDLESPDLIVLDLMMPEVDGFAVLEWIRGGPRTENLPVIVYTAKDLSKEERARLKTGAQAVVSKAGTGDLLKALRAALHSGAG